MRVLVNSSVSQSLMTQVQCIGAAVRCVQKELMLVTLECEDPEEYVGGAIEFWESESRLTLTSLLNDSDHEVSASAPDRV